MEYKIIDTGYLNTSMTGTQLAVDKRVGYDGSSSVSELDLPNVLLTTIDEKVNFDDTPQPDSDAITEVSTNSFDNDKLVIQFAIKKSELPTGYEVNYLYQLRKLSRTDGIKLLYPSGSGSLMTTPMYLGEEYKNGAFSTTFIPADTPYLPIKVTNVTFTDKPSKKYIGIKMTCVITK